MLSCFVYEVESNKSSILDVTGLGLGLVIGIKSLNETDSVSGEFSVLNNEIFIFLYKLLVQLGCFSTSKMKRCGNNSIFR